MVPLATELLEQHRKDLAVDTLIAVGFLLAGARSIRTAALLSTHSRRSKNLKRAQREFSPRSIQNWADSSENSGTDFAISAPDRTR